MGAIARTDIELVEASLRGEHEAFGHLVARYQDVVCAVSYSSTGDEVLSEDVAQETFIAAWRQLGRLRNSERLRPWLCGIARNLARTARKRRRREPLVAEGDERIVADTNPFDDAARGDVERIVREALARIPEAYREVLVLYYREEQPIREVAATLGLTEANAMQRLSRARRYLADSVTDIVEHSLRGERRRRDLVAGVLASIAAISIPSRVDASPPKGSTMLKSALAASALVAAGTTAYLVYSHRSEPARPAANASLPTLRFGSGRLGLAHAPSLGPTAAPRTLASRSTALADLELVPADSEAVLGLNFAQVRKSALFQQFVAPAIAASDELREFEALCGFDPLASLGSVTIGLKGLGEEPNTSGVIIVHGFDRNKAMSCFDKQGVADAEAEGMVVTVDGDVVLMKAPEGQGNAAFTFIDQTTGLVVIGPDAATKESVQRVAAGNGGVHTSSAFATALQAVNTDDSFWLMVAEGSALVKAINVGVEPYTPIRLGTMYMSLDATDSLALDAGFRLGSPDTVAKLVSTIETTLKTNELARDLAKHFDQLDVISDGSDLIVSLALSGDQILPLITSIATHTAVSSM